MRMLANIFWLGIKELRSFAQRLCAARPRHLVVLACDLSARPRATSRNCTMPRSRIVDEDHSHLSRRIAAAFCRPISSRRSAIARGDIDRADGPRALYLRHRHPAAFRARRAGRTRPGDPGQCRRHRHDAGRASAPATLQQIIATEVARLSSRGRTAGARRRSISRCASPSIPM